MKQFVAQFASWITLIWRRANTVPPARGGACRLHLESLEARTLRAVFAVGPGQAYTELWQVPWDGLGGGDEVDVHWRPNAYHSKIDITTSDISLIGIPGPLGQRPVIDGYGAREDPSASYFINDIASEGLITVAPATSYYVVDSVLIQGLELENANENSWYRAADRSIQWYQDSGAGVALYSATNVTIQDCSIHDNGNGIFGKSFADPYLAGDGNLLNVHVIGNTIYGNGVVGSDHEHNTYIEGIYTVYEFNTYGPLIDGAAGVALKDRSDQPTIAYNYITGGVHQLDLVDPDDGAPDLTADPGYGSEWVYGNVLVDNGTAGSIVHFGFDQVMEDSQTDLYFYDNTVVSWNSITEGGYYNTAIFKVGGGATVYAFDNIFHQQSFDGSRTGQFVLSWADYGSGTVYAGVNVGNANMFPDDGTTKTIGWENMVLTDDPGFVNVLFGDFRLNPNSPAVGAAKGIYCADGFTDELGLPSATYQYDFADGSGWLDRSSTTNLGVWESDHSGGTYLLQTSGGINGAETANLLAAVIFEQQQHDSIPGGS
jgi:hypothetical protein